MKTDSI